jgi:hypothetical protein
MLETIREYAAEQLAAAGETDEVQQRHMEHYTAVAVACSDETWSGLDDLARLFEERDNIRLALERALERDPETALVLAAHLAFYWVNHGESREGREKVTAALAAASGRPRPDAPWRSWLLAHWRARNETGPPPTRFASRHSSSRERWMTLLAKVARSSGSVGARIAVTLSGWHNATPRRACRY